MGIIALKKYADNYETFNETVIFDRFCEGHNANGFDVSTDGTMWAAYCYGHVDNLAIGKFSDPPNSAKMVSV